MAAGDRPPALPPAWDGEATELVVDGFLPFFAAIVVIAIVRFVVVEAFGKREETPPKETEVAAEEVAASWLDAHKEDHTDDKADMNQYWYSAATIATLVDVIREHCIPAPAARLDVAFVSTPSLFFALAPAERARCRLLEYDEELGVGEPGFVRYDFNEPEAVPDDCKGAFSLVVIDPPFITREVWAQYARTARLLLAPGGRLLCTTIAENAPMMAELLDVRPTAFLPSIPHLVYQYNVYANYESERLACPNDEIPGCE